MYEENKFSPNCYKSEQRVRWCPGCGNHMVLNSVHKAMAEMGLSPWEVVVVSGIGCSSRLTYYMNTYGFHTIHGRGAAIATGVKLANPNLSVWHITGDGDALAIGGNHFIHLVRRNVDMTVILLNNQVYGLTKGQFSPTSNRGSVTKTSPYGTIENPFRPGELTLGARGNFFARVIDKDLNHCVEVFKEASTHKGTSIVEVLQDCVIFNHKPDELFAGKDIGSSKVIKLGHGQPMVFGANHEMGLILEGSSLKAVKIGENGISLNDILVHDASEGNNILHMQLANMEQPGLPVALGVIRKVSAPAYDEEMETQIQHVKNLKGIATFHSMASNGEVWELGNGTSGQEV